MTLLRPAALLFAATMLAACDPDMPNPDEAGDGGDAQDTDAEAGETEVGETEAPMDVPSEPEPEACEAWGTSRACTEGVGTQYCDDETGTLVWGECVADPICKPGDWSECFPGDDTFGGLAAGCLLTDGVPGWDPDACNTPLVLSFSPDAPIEMLGSAAAFDISGAGECLATDWPAAENPWLAIDLDRSGAIEGGHELFGSGTLLDSGRHARNGFVALSSLDADADGKLTPADPRFAELLIWRDLDLDKRSLPHELSTLAEAGVTLLELGHAVEEQCDARGNCGRERAGFEFVAAGGAAQRGQLVDVYLACQ